jgi:hypothetical protein
LQVRDGQDSIFMNNGFILMECTPAFWVAIAVVAGSGPGVCGEKEGTK